MLSAAEMTRHRLLEQFQEKGAAASVRNYTRTPSAEASPADSAPIREGLGSSAGYFFVFSGSRTTEASVVRSLNVKVWKKYNSTLVAEWLE